MDKLGHQNKILKEKNKALKKKIRKMSNFTGYIEYKLKRLKKVNY